MSVEASPELLGGMTDAQRRSMEKQAFWSALLAGPCLLLCDAAIRWGFRFRIANLREFRRELDLRLVGHEGPVIWVSNHLTHVDPFLIGLMLSPRLRTLGRWLAGGMDRYFPWIVAEGKHHERRDKGWLGRLYTAVTYLGRSIYVWREGEGAREVESRRTLHARVAWVLARKGRVGFFPEAARSRRGWLDASEPKPFIGELARDFPDAGILCIYLRGERQQTWSNFPRKGESFRAYCDWIAPAARGDSVRAVSEAVFERLGALQERWFKGAAIRKNCAGVAVVDRRQARGEAADAVRERAIRSAVAAALGQAELVAPEGDEDKIEVKLFVRKALHVPTQTEVPFRLVADDPEKAACVAVLRGGRLGDEADPGDVVWSVDEAPASSDPKEFAERRLIELVCGASDDIRPEELDVSWAGGSPSLLRGGKPQDWGASVSSSGRFVGCAFLTS